MRKKDLENELNEAEEKAWTALEKYKFMMFGYWAAIWVHLNRVGKFKKNNPFIELIKFARAKKVSVLRSKYRV